MTRNALFWPFDSASHWNMPIGSGAIYVSAQLPSRRDSAIGHEKIPMCMDTTQPSTPVYKDNTQGTRNCTGNTGATVPACVNQTLIIGASGANYPCAFIAPDGSTRLEGGNFSHCSNGGQAASNSHFGSFGSITDLGLTGGAGGSNLSNLGGTLRYGELTSGTIGDGASGLINFIRHALRFNLYGHTDLDHSGPPGNPGAGWRWPATHADGGYNVSTDNNYYGGSVADSVMGSLYALHSSVILVINSGVSVVYSTVGGKGTITDTLQGFGINALAGYTCLVGGNIYTVATNTAQVITLSTGWTGGTPANGVQYGINSLGLTTVPGMIFAWNLQNYGGYVCNNSSGSNGAAGYGWPICTELSAVGDVANEFLGIFGYNFAQNPGANAWATDCDTLLTHLYVISNNSSSSIGGGGTPRQNLAPSFLGAIGNLKWHSYTYKH